MPHKIFVGNLSEDTRSEDIRPMFEKYGKVTECDVLNKYGFVHMEEEKEASDAIDGLCGLSLHGCEISVQKSHGGRGRGGGGFRGPFRGSYRGSSYSSRPIYGGRGDYNRDAYSRYSSSSRDGYDRYSRYESSYDDYPRSSYERRRPYPDPYERREERYSDRRTSSRAMSPPEYRGSSSYSRPAEYDRRRSPPPRSSYTSYERSGGGSSLSSKREYSSRDYPSSREYSSREYSSRDYRDHRH